MGSSGAAADPAATAVLSGSAGLAPTTASLGSLGAGGAAASGAPAAAGSGALGMLQGLGQIGRQMGSFNKSVNDATGINMLGQLLTPPGMGKQQQPQMAPLQFNLQPNAIPFSSLGAQDPSSWMRAYSIMGS